MRMRMRRGRRVGRDMLERGMAFKAVRRMLSVVGNRSGVSDRRNELSSRLRPAEWSGKAHGDPIHLPKVANSFFNAAFLFRTMHIYDARASSTS